MSINSSSFSVASNPKAIVCPKPRRLVSQQMEDCESWAGTELLEIILAKANYRAEKHNFQVALSPPFFNGSPPMRASNPLIQDEQFGIAKMSPLSPSTESTTSPSSRIHNSGRSSSSGHVKCGSKPAPVRIEGFNCCGISAVMA
ncbi:hypothetical protein ACH5RR_008673 [Cinchona calisaya]|uniref:Uncharacterized protein n=1 Tax=Cinchona calisaya TaxID=153742 RepID=A0ABD3AC12_9GENT